MVSNSRTNDLAGLTAQQRNAALIEQHQSRALLAGVPGTAWLQQPAVRAPEPVAALRPAPGTIQDLRDNSDTEMALVWQYAELERQRAENAAILDAADEAMVLISHDHRLVNANRRFCELLGSSRDRLLGLHVHQIRPILLTLFGSDDVCLHLRWKSGPIDPAAIHVEQIYPEPRTHAMVVTDVDSFDSGSHGRLFSFRDVTQQLELDRMKDDFIATVSHELRTPLTSISGFLDLLMRGSAGELPDQATTYLEIVQRNVAGLVEQVNELLEFSRLEAGACAMDLTTVELRSLLAEAVAVVSPMINERHQRLTIHLPDSTPAVTADRARLMQVMVNLISNANRYTLEGGSITISASVLDKIIRIDIADTGIGLTAREQELVFTRFYRAEATATTEIGSGLGLPIARSLIERMGGRIWVQSSPGQGSTFSITVPIATA